MQIFGLTVARTSTLQKQLQSVESRVGWRRVIGEPFPGAWQCNVSVNQETVLSYHADFACRTLIASDISKMRVKLVQKDDNGIWSETSNPAYSPVLRKPNHFQNRIQFFENWVLSKLQNGNAYILKQRDARQVVTKLYVLDPCRVRPMVSDGGEVFYELRKDPLSYQSDDVVIVPAREIIHDRFNCFFHPLCGLSPIFANGLAATQGLNIQNNSAAFFQNAARPSGILTAPGDISQQTADNLKVYWEQNFSGNNAAKIAVLGDGLQYKAMTMTSVDAQMIEQLKWTAEVVCSTYHVPPYKIGVGAMPSYNNVQALNVEYYSQCLQVLIEAMELALDEGLGIGDGVPVSGTTYGTEFDVDNLLRMDTVTQMEALKNSAGILSPNEMRAKLDKKPAEGGESPMVQQQNYSLAALAKRDAQEDPFGTAQPALPPANDGPQQAAFLPDFRKYLSESLIDAA